LTQNIAVVFLFYFIVLIVFRRLLQQPLWPN